MKDKEITVTADELQKQKLYTADVAAIMQVRAMHGTPKALVRTYGCQQNVADGERMKGMLSEMGFEFTEYEDEADFILFNTCAIREHAEDRVFGNIGALKNVKRRNPSLLIAVCGCMMEQERVAERIKVSFPFVNIVFGTHVIHRLPEMMYTAVTDSKRVFLRGHESKEIIEGLPVRRDGNTRAWVTVMYGCDNFCSYCIVPYVRGRERSREPERILKEIRELVETGYLRRRGKAKDRMKRPATKPMEFRSTSGLRISVGRNNLQNDRLTTKQAGKWDYWFHTQKIHGAHVILWTDGQKPDEQSLHEAACLAAWFSQGSQGKKIPVDYTPVKFVKKPAGARPGMVVYTTYQTAYVDPDPKLAEKLKP